jgi:hypothetical protein
MSMDFNDATGKQRSTELIPAGTVATVEMHIRSGNAGPGGWFKRAKDGRSEALDCEFSVLDGDHARRKFWALLTMVGTTDGHGQMGEANRALLCTILESARGITPKDMSEAAKQARQVESYGVFDGLRFIAKIGIKRGEPRPDGSGNYPDRNVLLEAITPDHKQWHSVEQQPSFSKSSGGAASAAASGGGQGIPRPQWGH